MSSFIRYIPISIGGGGGGGSTLSMGTFDGQAAAAQGATITLNQLFMQSADATHPGLVNTTTQTFAGQKTFSTGLTGTLTGHATLDVATSSLGNLTDAGTDGIVVTGGTGAVVGTVSLAQHVADTTHNGYLSSTDWNTFNNKQAALTLTNLTDTGTDGIAITNGTGAVVGASPVTIAQHVADTSHNGYLTATDWNTFNNKQAALTLTNLTDTGTDGITITNGTGAVIGGSAVTIAQHVADTTHNGYLSSTDWNTFNGKGAGSVTQVALTVPTFLSISGSPITTSGTLAISLSGTALPIANGGTGVTSVTTAPAASSFAGWDANKNLSANNLLDGYTTTATAAAITTLVVGDTGQQIFTGSTTQTVKLPAVSTLALGMQYIITNLSSGVVTVQSSGANTLQAMAANTQLTCTVISLSGTGTASWNWVYQAVQGALTTGTVTSVAASGPSGIATWSSAVTGSGTLTQTLSNQSAGTFLAGPTSGSAAAPTFRALQAPTIQKFTATGSTAGYRFTVSSANATVGATYTNNGNTYTVLATIAAATTLYCSQASAPQASGTLTRSSGSGDATITFSAAVAYATYTPAAGALYIRVRMVGGGGGGGGLASGSSNGGAGGESDFGAAILVAKGGNLGTSAGTGGSATSGSSLGGMSGILVEGAGGGNANGSVAGTSGGVGGSSYFGGAGQGGIPGTVDASAATANSGSGGGGAENAGASGAGAGGAGAFIDAIITSLAASYPYVVGASGAAGSGTRLGGAGAAGQIEVTEYYQ